MKITQNTLKRHSKRHTKLVLSKAETYKRRQPENKALIEFAKLLNVTPTDITAKSKCSDITDIRHLYCKLRYEMHGLTYLRIGCEIGRHHSTVRYGILRINNLLFYNDKNISAMWNRVKDILAFYAR